MSVQLLTLIEKYKVTDDITKKIFERFFLPELQHYKPSNDQQEPKDKMAGRENFLKLFITKTVFKIKSLTLFLV